LVSIGYALVPLSGTFEYYTQAATESLQYLYDLSVTGAVDVTTWEAAFDYMLGWTALFCIDVVPGSMVSFQYGKTVWGEVVSVGGGAKAVVAGDLAVGGIYSCGTRSGAVVSITSDVLPFGGVVQLSDDDTRVIFHNVPSLGGTVVTVDSSSGAVMGTSTSWAVPQVILFAGYVVFEYDYATLTRYQVSDLSPMGTLTPPVGPAGSAVWGGMLVAPDQRALYWSVLQGGGSFLRINRNFEIDSYMTPTDWSQPQRPFMVSQEEPMTTVVPTLRQIQRDDLGGRVNVGSGANQPTSRQRSGRVGGKNTYW
jgi:hypothetical protein